MRLNWLFWGLSGLGLALMAFGFLNVIGNLGYSTEAAGFQALFGACSALGGSLVLAAGLRPLASTKWRAAIAVSTGALMVVVGFMSALGTWNTALDLHAYEALIGGSVLIGGCLLCALGVSSLSSAAVRKEEHQASGVPPTPRHPGRVP